MKEYKVIEDNGGGLALVVFAEDGETVEYIHTGYEYNPGQLTEDLAALKNGDDPVKDWDGNDLNNAEMEAPEDLESWFAILLLADQSVARNIAGAIIRAINIARSHALKCQK